jgi:hypothetical protein
MVKAMSRGIPYIPNERDRTTVSVGLSWAFPINEIADRMGVPERTLRRHYPDAFRQAELKVGRPTDQPTPEEREFVRFAASKGVPHTEIAPLIGCSKGTLRKYFAHELRLGKAQANLSVGAQLYRIATGDPTLPTTVIAAIFWAKCHMGWRQTRRVQPEADMLGDDAAGDQVVIVGTSDGT